MWFEQNRTRRNQTYSTFPEQFAYMNFGRPIRPRNDYLGLKFAEKENSSTAGFGAPAKNP